MIKKMVTSSCLVLAFIGSPNIANSADLDNIIYAPELRRSLPVEVGNGWYLRGDLGYTYKRNGAATSYRTYSGGTYSSNSFDTSRLSGDLTGAIGAGYTFNQWFRADATIGFAAGGFNGTTSAATPCSITSPVGTTCASTDSANYSAYDLMANAYVDLGTYAGFTPYVGAGAGVSFVKWGALSNNSYCVNGAGICGVTPSVTTSHAGLSSWRFTYALMGGVSYDISRNLKLDLNYRYSKTGSGNMFNFDNATITSGATGAQASDNGFERHEVRAGLRYSLW